MQINRGTEYAIRATLYLATHDADAPMLLTDIAEGIGAPPNYLSNLLQALTRFGIVQAHRGSRRGYSLGKPPARISLLEIIEALEGPLSFGCCTVGAGEYCPLSEGCAVTDVFSGLLLTVRDRLGKASLAKMLRPPRSRTAQAGRKARPR